MALTSATIVATLLYRETMAAAFEELGMRFDEAFRSRPRASYSHFRPYPDFAVFRIDGARIVLAYCDGMEPPPGTDLESPCSSLVLAVSFVLGEGQPITLAEKREELARSILERVTGLYPPQAVLWSETGGEFGPDEFDAMVHATCEDWAHVVPAQPAAAADKEAAPVQAEAAAKPPQAAPLAAQPLLAEHLVRPLPRRQNRQTETSRQAASLLTAEALAALARPEGTAAERRPYEPADFSAPAAADLPPAAGDADIDTTRNDQTEGSLPEMDDASVQQDQDSLTAEDSQIEPAAAAAQPQAPVSSAPVSPASGAEPRPKAATPDRSTGAAARIRLARRILPNARPAAPVLPANSLPDLPHPMVEHAARIRDALYTDEHGQALFGPDGKAPTVERLTLYTLNASLLIAAAPVGAALLTYNALGRESLKLTSRAVALTGFAVALSHSAIGASLLNYL